MVESNTNMNKMRVYELAKELGHSSKALLEMLRNMGVDARGNFSVLEVPTVKRVLEMVKRGGEGSPGTVEPQTDGLHEDKATPAAPTQQVVQPAKQPQVQRTASTSTSQTVVTTIDPAAAAAMSMARSATGPKPKPGGEVRRIIPAAKLEASRAQQGTATARPPLGPLRPAEVTQVPASRATAAVPAASVPTAPHATTAATVPARPVGVGTGSPPRATGPVSVRSGVTVTPAPVRSTSTVGAPQVRSAAGASTAASVAPSVGTPSRSTAIRQTAATVAGETVLRPAVPPPARPSTARPGATNGLGVTSPSAAIPTAPVEVHAARTAVPVPVEPSLQVSTPSVPPPQRPLRGSGPAVRPITSPSPPRQIMYPGHRPPYRPGGRMGKPFDRGAGKKKGSFAPSVPQTPQPTVELKNLELPDHISVTELASKLEISPTEIIKTLMSQGLLVTINQTITFDKAQQIAVSHGFNAILTEEHEEVTQESEKEEDLVTRPPVVTVLGHVDHGKTSLLDAIRNTNVTAGEAGGITQSIGAYVVDHDGRKITFIDTPGHEAFTAMRARGAKVTDVAVLVVAADDGIMPQTVEAINHAKAAKVPIVVAVNKIDKPNANVDKVKQQLTEYELVPEDWGGTTITCPISAKQRLGIDELLEMILLVADMQELKANPDRKAHGIIIEAKLDKGLGPVATVLVQTGTLKINDAVVVGQSGGKVRAIINDHGKRIGKVMPGTPGEIIGLSTVPTAGDVLQVVDDEKVARQIVEAREQRTRERGMSPTGARTSLDDLFNKMQAGEIKDLNLIVKADNQGSVEALKHSLLRLTDAAVKVNVVHGGVGTITESDILLATASGAIVIGFNVRPDPNVKKLADQEGVDIRNYRVIYHVIEDIQAAMKGMLAPEFEEVQLGRVEVRQVFKVSKIGTIAGCFVVDGKVTRGADVRVLRDGVVTYEGKIDSLRRFKDDVREVAAGYECGLSIEKFPGVQVGDIVEVYKMEEKPRE